MAKEATQLNNILTPFDDKQVAIDLSKFRVLPPETNIHDEPTRCYRFNLQWAKILIGFLSFAETTAFWHESEDESYDAIRQVIHALEGEECLPPVIPSNGCIRYPTYHSSISYFPINPYIDPTGVPSGFAEPPFDIYRGGDIFPVNDLFDITVRLSSFSFFSNWWEIIGGNLPYVKIKVSGIGEMEIKLQNRPFGGRIAITIDRPLNAIDMFVDGLIDTGAIFVEVNQDITSFPGESVKDFSIEQIFDTDTVHEVWLTFVPVMNDSLIPFEFGGVFKGYTLCGLTPVSQEEDIVIDVRVSADNCSIEKLVNGNWVNAGSILPCITAQTVPLQTQITNNDNDILAIQNVNITQSSDIILLFEENDIQDTDITNLQNQTNNLQTQITNNDTDISSQGAVDSNHDIRITALENAPIVGGVGAMLTSVYTVSQGSNASNNTTDFIELGSALFSHQFTYDTALINLIIRAETSGGGSQYCYTKIRCGGIDSIEKNQVKGTSVVQDASLAARFMNIDTLSPVDIVPIFRSSSTGTTAKISAKQVVSITIIEYGQGDVVTNEHLVTFDAGGDAFAYDSDTLAYSVQIGGNPDNALIANNFVIGNYLEVDIDLGASRNIDAIEWQGYSTSAGDTAFYIKIDGVSQGGAALGIQSLDNTWETHDLNDFNPPLSGLVGQIVTIGMGCGSNTISEFRFDNLKVTYS